jgi:hypothetical protein
MSIPVNKDIVGFDVAMLMVRIGEVKDLGLIKRTGGYSQGCVRLQ